TDILFRGLVLDMNYPNNTISPNRGIGTYSQVTFAHIIFSGTPSGTAAAGTDVWIEDCEFINTPGANCIVLAQSNTTSVTLGKRWTIRTCLFNNNGMDTDDHSSIYAWADDVLIDGNTFTADSMTSAGNAGAGPRVAFEVHGANHRVVHNKVRNY